MTATSEITGDGDSQADEAGGPAGHRQELARTGQVTVRSVFSTRRAAKALDLVTTACSKADRLLVDEANEAYRRAFDQYLNLWQIDEAMRTISLDKRLGAIAADLLGVPRVRIYHDQALIKRAGGGPTPWHQDHWYWPLDGPAVTMWMPLVDMSPDMGELEFASGSHQAGGISKGGTGDISADSEAFHERWLVDNPHERKRTGAMAAGDASFHMSWTLHRADANTTKTDRPVMTVIWFADGAEIIEPDNDGRRNDLAQWLPGQQPGDIAASALNPLV